MATISCHPHDLKWVNEQLRRLPAVKQFEIAIKYSEAYESGATRRECNTRLREYIEKYNVKICKDASLNP